MSEFWIISVPIQSYDYIYMETRKIIFSSILCVTSPLEIKKLLKSDVKAMAHLVLVMSIRSYNPSKRLTRLDFLLNVSRYLRTQTNHRLHSKRYYGLTRQPLRHSALKCCAILQTFIHIPFNRFTPLISGERLLPHKPS